jgi:hypothetical protein
MPTRSIAELIAKLLARAAMTDSPAEAESSIRGAYGRMRKEGVSLDDLLFLDDDQLYQDGLIDLARYIVKQQDELSEGCKRALLAEYMAKISARFTPSANSYQQHADGYGEQGRAEEPYREAHREPTREEGERLGRFTLKDFFTLTGIKVFLRQIGIQTIELFRYGGFLWHCARQPVRAAKLLAASVMVGFFGALALLFIAATLHSVLGLGGPWLDMKLQRVWIFLAVVVALCHGAFWYRRGWF